jgi:hypothetical protein
MNWVKEDLLWAFIIGLIWLVQKLWRHRETIARMFSAGSEEGTGDDFPFDPQAVEELKATLRRRAAAAQPEFEAVGMDDDATPEDEFENVPMEAEAGEVPTSTTVSAAVTTAAPTAGGTPVGVHPIVAALRRHPQAGIVLAEILGPPKGLR